MLRRASPSDILTNHDAGCSASDILTNHDTGCSEDIPTRCLDPSSFIFTTYNSLELPLLYYNKVAVSCLRGAHKNGGYCEVLGIPEDLYD